MKPELSSVRRIRNRNYIVQIISLGLAYLFTEGLLPTPNVTGGGTFKMLALIFLTVTFKAVIEYFLRRMKEYERNDGAKK